MDMYTLREPGAGAGGWEICARHPASLSRNG